MLLSKTHYVQEAPSRPLFMDTMDGLAKNMEEPAQRLTQHIHRCLSRDFYFKLLKIHFLVMDL